MPTEPGGIIGAYEILGPLGSGGMGYVYRARDTRLGRQVAIKFIAADIAADPTATERLAREARLTSSLNHPNIVTVHDVGEAEGRPFLVMELVEGQSLHDALAAGAMPMARAIDLAAQIADGLAAAHDAGVIHRDLKPRNIMLTTDGRPKIVDFGLGKAGPRATAPEASTQQAEGLTDSRAILGTAGYMAPEQVAQRAVDFRADQFALGAIIYEMLTGLRAFKRDSAVQTMAAIVESEPVPLAELVPDVPESLARIVDRCLAKHPGDRYRSTLDLSHDLRDLRDAAKSASHSRSAARARPRRRRVALAGIAVGLVAGVVVVWQATRAGGALDQPRALLLRYDKADEVERAAQLLQAEVQRSPANAAAHALLAEAMWRQYEHTRRAELIDGASAAAADALRLDDRQARTHVVLAMINYGQGRYDGAKGEAERAIQLDARLGAAWRELGRVYLAQRSLAEAGEAFRRAVEFAPDDWSAFNHLGALQLLTGHFADALPYFERARELAPDNTRIYNNLGSTYLQLDRYGEAAQMYERSLSIQRNATAYSNLGTAYYQQGLYADAARAFEGAVALPGATVEHWRNLGAACYWAEGLRGRAKDAYERAVELGEQARDVNPRDAAVLVSLASSYAVLSTFRDAPESAARARAIVAGLERQPPQNAEHLSVIAGVWEALGDRQRALDWLAKAVAGGYAVKRIEQSPWFAELRKDARYSRIRTH